ncbi:MAG: NADH-quinone oxidoreductase subunit C, partial [Bacteroidota bacterium]
LSCITALDNGTEAGSFELIYNFYSIPFDLKLDLKIVVPRISPDGDLPRIQSIASIFGTANWHEREAYDMLGIHFTGHPDLRRILLPADWQGYPLRKDYELQQDYHGLKVPY